MDPLTSYTPPPLSATYTAGVQPGSSVAQSYSNPGGSGPRGSLITATNSAFFTTGTAASLVDGATGNVAYFSGASASGNYLRFDFGAARKITEAKWYQSATDNHGTWKWQGSQDASSWTDIGSSFTFGGATTQTQTALSGNSTAYRYYQLLGVSGTTGTSSWVYEMEFKIDDPSSLNLSALSVSGLALFQGPTQLLQDPIWPVKGGSYVWIAPATTGGAPAFRAITRADIGNLGLTPSDMPSQVAKYSRATSAQGSLSGSYAKNTVALNSVDANPNSNWSFSGGVATCVNAGVYDLVAQLYYSSTEGFFIINHNGNAIGGYYYSSGASGLWGQISVLGVSVGVGDTIEIDFFSSVAGGTIGNTYTGISVNAADKHATWLRLARRQ